MVVAPAFGGQLQGKGVDVENFPGVLEASRPSAEGLVDPPRNPVGSFLQATGPGLVARMRRQAAAFNATMRLAVDPPVHSRRLRNAWPGFRHPSDVQEPLQGGFLHNMLEDVGPARVDPVFGKTPWPDAAYRATVVAVNELIYDTSHRVLSGVDRLEVRSRDRHSRRRVSSCIHLHSSASLCARSQRDAPSMQHATALAPRLSDARDMSETRTRP